MALTCAEADRAAAGRAAAEKVVYLKSVLTDMRCQLITFLVAEADRAAAGRAAAEKVCVPKIGFARHRLANLLYIYKELCRSRAAAVPQPKKFVYLKLGSGNRNEIQKLIRFLYFWTEKKVIAIKIIAI